MQTSIETTTQTTMQTSIETTTQTTMQTSIETTKKIVVIQAGFVVIGQVQEFDDRLLITDASVIRKWGTTAGLGQIALQGVTSETILDPCGMVEVYLQAVIMQIKC